ncbi:glycosyltransferase [Knoellia sp. CPCC 206450]|uniref:glycosyltransferase n=1 Tax=Knoellia tibetensis TaxID=3404798 RepID=UPI003B435AE5
MTGPLVSVVVPVHDVVDYLDACVGSIVGQTHTALDVVLVDDGSTDGSEALCDAWAERDLRVRVVHQAAQGSSVARNVGIDAAHGDWLTFADSDDVLSPDLVAILLAAAVGSGAEIALGEHVAFEEGEQVAFTPGSTVTVSPAAVETMQVMCVRPQWGPVAKLLRRDLLVDGPRFPEGLLHQDLAFTPRVFGRATLVARTDAVVYGYRQRRGSVTDTVRRVALSPDLVTILRGNIDLARRTTPARDFARYLAAYLRHAVRQLERIGDADAWRRNEPYVRACRELLRDHLPEAAATGAVHAPTRAAWRLAVTAPRPYAVSARSVRRLRTVVGARVRAVRARA